MSANKTSSLARAITLFSPAEIRNLISSAKTRYKEVGLHIKTAPALLDHGRILIVIPRKVGSAVTRNKLRRHIKHIYYEEQLYQKPNDIIIYCYPELTSLSYQELKKLLVEVLSQ